MSLRPAQERLEPNAYAFIVDLRHASSDLADEAGSACRHERFRLQVAGQVVEVDHNLTLAPRAPVVVGATVIVHGQFEPDPGHLVIHYAHHATGAHEGGWIKLDGHRYS